MEGNKRTDTPKSGDNDIKDIVKSQWKEAKRSGMTLPEYRKLVLEVVDELTNTPSDNRATTA